MKNNHPSFLITTLEPFRVLQPLILWRIVKVGFELINKSLALQVYTEVALQGKALMMFLHLEVNPKTTCFPKMRHYQYFSNEQHFSRYLSYSSSM